MERHVGISLPCRPRQGRGGRGSAEHSKPTAIIIKAAALRTLMAVPVLLPRHIQSGGGGARVRLQGVSAEINSGEMNPLSLFLASDAGRGRRAFSRRKRHSER